MSDPILNRYALALALIPDQDVAGDLFMDAKSDPDLLRRANTWRRRSGLQAIVELPQPVPPLAEAQREQGLHLARRARVRRRVRSIGLAAAFASMLFGVVLAWRGGVGKSLRTMDLSSVKSTAAPQSLASGAAFESEPIAQADPSQDGVTFMIHKAEATPGEVTLWWEVRGTHRLNSSVSLIPGVSLKYPGTTVEHLETQRAMIRSNRIVGRSTYRAVITQPVDLMVSVESYGGSKVDWNLQVPVSTDGLDQAPVVVELNKTFEMSGFQVTVESVTISPMQTLVRYRRDLPANMSGLYLIAFRTPGGPGGARSPLFPAQTREENGKLTARLAPIISGMGEMDLYFSNPYQSLGSFTFPLPDDQVLSDWGRNAAGASATLHLSDGTFPAGPGAPFITGTDGKKYELTLRPNLRGGSYTLQIQVRNFPPEVTPVQLTFPTLIKASPAPEPITIDLLHPQS